MTTELLLTPEVRAAFIVEAIKESQNIDDIDWDELHKLTLSNMKSAVKAERMRWLTGISYITQKCKLLDGLSAPHNNTTASVSFIQEMVQRIVSDCTLEYSELEVMFDNFVTKLNNQSSNLK